MKMASIYFHMFFNIIFYFFMRPIYAIAFAYLLYLFHDRDYIQHTFIENLNITHVYRKKEAYI